MISNEWVAAAQVASGFAALIALGITAYQIYRSRLASDLIALQTFFSGVTERERALAQADKEGGYMSRHSFVELANFIELYAGVDNKRLLGSACRPFVRDKVADSIVVFELTGQQSKIRDATTTSDTFSEIAIFVRRHKKLIRKRRAELNKTIEETSGDD